MVAKKLTTTEGESTILKSTIARDHCMYFHPSHSSRLTEGRFFTALTGLWYCPTCSSAGLLQARARARRPGRNRLHHDDDDDDEDEADLDGFIVPDEEVEELMIDSNWGLGQMGRLMSLVLPRTLATVRVRRTITRRRQNAAARNNSTIVIATPTPPRSVQYRLGTGISKLNNPVFRVFERNYPGSGSGFGYLVRFMILLNFFSHNC